MVWGARFGANRKADEKEKACVVWRLLINAAGKGIKKQDAQLGWPVILF